MLPKARKAASKLTVLPKFRCASSGQEEPNSRAGWRQVVGKMNRCPLEACRPEYKS